MKKIIISLSIMAMVAGVVIGATSAYFSDTETSSGNTITAGTIDIKINGENPWTSPFTIGDLKPGETDYMNLGIENVGQNPAEIYKRIYGMSGDTGDHSFGCDGISSGVSSDPECRAAQTNNNNDLNDLQNQIFYDLSVKIYESKSAYDQGNNPVWWQTIETGGRTLAQVYPDDNTQIDLGMLPVGGYMFVEQSYRFNPDAGNIYQGDVLTFNMEVKAEQLAQSATGQATVVLENKSGAPDWAIISGDGIQGTLTYKTKGPTFDYNFIGTVHTANIAYTLIYVGPSGNYPCSESKIIGQGTASGTNLTLSGTPDLGIDITGGKVWLIPSSAYDTGTGLMTSWPQADILFETGLVNYDDTDI